MNRAADIAILIVAIVALIVVIDVLLLRERFWLRLVINVDIVAIAAVVYGIFLRH